MGTSHRAVSKRGKNETLLPFYWFAISRSHLRTFRAIFLALPYSKCYSLACLHGPQFIFPQNVSGQGHFLSPQRASSLSRILIAKVQATSCSSTPCSALIAHSTHYPSLQRTHRSAPTAASLLCYSTVPSLCQTKQRVLITPPKILTNIPELRNIRCF